MKVLFTHGYFIHEDEKEKEIMRPYPPLGILYLSAYLEKNGIDNEVFDTTFSSKENLYETLIKSTPDIIAIYTNLMTKLNVIEIISFIKDKKELAKMKIVLGGPDVSYNIDNYLATGADILVIGEGEQTMLEIVQCQEQNISFESVNGIAFKDKNGDTFKTLPRQRIRPVDDIPFPNRKKINLNLYLEAWKKHHGQNAISISTQRGCPYTCKWCSTAVYGQSYRRRSPEIVVDEIIELHEQYNPDSLWFVDDVFTVSHKWLKEFREEINQRKVKIPFECITRADRLSIEVLKDLKAAGAFRVWIGAESGSQKILDAMDRRVESEQVIKMIQAARSLGIEAGTFIMLGYPSETQEDIELTIDHLIRAKPDHVTITVAYPIKGTGLYEEVKPLFTDTLDWNTSTDRDIDFKRTYPKKYYKHAVRRVINEFNYHKSKANNSVSFNKRMIYKIKYKLASLGMLINKK